MKTIGIIDYGMGNLGSVSNACRFLKLDSLVLEQPDQISQCRALILPGVGAFKDCMTYLNQSGFAEAARSWIDSGRPFLGICLGLQILYEGSEESPGTAGLNVFPGTIRRFRLDPELKVPQIGWNRVRQVRPKCPLFHNIPNDAFFYFVHSYYAAASTDIPTAGTTDYGIDYTSAVWRDNVMAVQFHPEKSQHTGLQVLKNFSSWTEKQGAVS